MAADGQAGFMDEFDIDHMTTDTPGDVWNRTLSLKQINRIVSVALSARRSVPIFETVLIATCATNAANISAGGLPLFNLLWPGPDADLILTCGSRPRAPSPFWRNVQRRAVSHLHRSAGVTFSIGVPFCGGPLRRGGSLTMPSTSSMAMHGNAGRWPRSPPTWAPQAAISSVSGTLPQTPDRRLLRASATFPDGHLPLTDAPGLGGVEQEVCAKYCTWETLLARYAAWTLPFGSRHFR